MTDRYDEMLSSWVNVAYSINGHIDLDPYNCPDTADKLGDYLNGGALVAARFGQPHYTITGSFGRTPFQDIVNRLIRAGHGHHVVVRGLRARPPHHYFLVANIRGQAYLLDAYTRERPIAVSNQTALNDYLHARGRFQAYESSNDFDAPLVVTQHPAGSSRLRTPRR